MSVEIPLKLKYRMAKPRGHFRADYNGNTGASRRKGKLWPVGCRPRKRLVRRYA